ncbi:phosphoethanolamine--lipid A transferase [Steroidobacter sp. S1-65]|uniref:Phosphoethanolamine--lipid A transferase n=1 Tax=Steroidobacter gossypii TaxID=2805490 RepID=A0ABS1X3D7_9GAMM|nr:phosphoethanolamine--lipid A transferase [Steroidobacter gossypii]MBM0107738.1 phosphoethanolamine--lipid A transferase [Steroidobacter gossypii]
MHTQHLLVPQLPLHARIRERWAGGIVCSSDVAFAFIVAFIWLSLYNVRFWELAAAAMWRPGLGASLFMISLFVVAWMVLALLLLVLPSRWLMRAAASALFAVAALSAYFCNEYGVIMNQDMMRNVLQTDRAEVGALLSGDMWLHLIVLGLIPSLLVWRVQLPKTSWRTRLGQRALAIVIALGLAFAGMFANSADFATLFREHKPVRYTLNPAAPVVSTIGLLADSRDRRADQPLLNPSGRVERTAAPSARPLVLFLVIGETARAANFQLGGYARETNPELSRIAGLTYFAKVTACGTSTAISVPCLFSHLPREHFKVDEAARYTNLLDSLLEAGFDVQWRDNNSGCKGVCARVGSIDYKQSNDPRYCRGSNCFDAVMLADLPEVLHHIQRDTVIVFHQKGSHGPAYSERYPKERERFKPACRSNQLQHCSQQEITNAYDNTLAYTDHVLARQIGMLLDADARLDSLLLYVSDHGESLGENGLYLHGMPYAFAPAVQKEVPMLLWASPGYLRRTQLRLDCLRESASLPVSHDFFYHTVLGAAQARSQVYDRALDLTAGCRQSGGHE